MNEPNYDPDTMITFYELSEMAQGIRSVRVGDAVASPLGLRVLRCEDGLSTIQQTSDKLKSVPRVKSFYALLDVGMDGGTMAHIEVFPRKETEEEIAVAKAIRDL